MICVDANILLRLYLGGPYQEQLDELWQQWIDDRVKCIAPLLFPYEITSVVRRYVFLGKISFERGCQTYTEILSQDISLEPIANSHDEAWKMAQMYDLPETYDAHYLALAQHRGIVSSGPWINGYSTRYTKA